MIRPVTAVVGVLVILALLLAPYLRPWLEQRSQLEAGRAQVAQLEQDVAQLTDERRRWDDPAYVKAQARDRLRYVMPGEVGYVVLDDVPADTASEDPRAASAAVPDAPDKQPWYDTVVRSVQLAGAGEQPGAAPQPSAAVTPSPSPSAR